MLRSLVHSKGESCDESPAGDAALWKPPKGWQCSGPVRELSSPKTAEQMKSVEICSLERIAETAENYPIYIKPASDGIYVTTSERDRFATKITSRDELDDFIRDFVV